MGTFLGHLVPGLALCLLGLWHTINNTKAYFLKGSANFRIRLWYPFCCPFFKSKLLELILILSFSLLSISLNIFEFHSLHFVFKLDGFEHAAMFFHLALFAVFAIYAELTHSYEILSGFIGILMASVFAEELFLLHFHSTDHAGLEGHYHWLLQVIVTVSLIAATAVASCPNNFTAALVLSISVLFQGCWFINMGFILWIPNNVPRGCTANLAKASHSTTVIHGAVTCKSHEADMRARALANLQFSWMLSGILVLVGCISLKLARKFSGKQSIAYEQLNSKGAEVLPISIDEFKHVDP